VFYKKYSILGQQPAESLGVGETKQKLGDFAKKIPKVLNCVLTLLSQKIAFKC